MNPAKFCLFAVGAALLGGFGAHVFFPPTPRRLTPPISPLAGSPAPAATPPAAQADPEPGQIIIQAPALPPLPSPSANAEKIAALRAIFDRQPEQSIPELKLATETDWHRAVDDGLDTPEQIRRALAAVRRAAERRFAEAVQPVLSDYLKANGGNFPTDPALLLPFVSKEIELAMLQRYRIAPASEFPYMVQGQWAMTQATIIDAKHHTYFVIDSHNVGTTSSPQLMRDLKALERARNAYKAEHGAIPRDMRLLEPYMTTPEEHAAIRSIEAFEAGEKAAQEKSKKL